MPQISKEKIEQNLTAAKEVDAILATLNQPRHRGIEAAIAMLQGLLDQPDGEPVAWMKSSNHSTDWDEFSFSANQFGDFKTPLYTHPTPFTPITTDMVTDEILEVIEDEISMGRNAWDLAPHKELVAAAVNACMRAKK